MATRKRKKKAARKATRKKALQRAVRKRVSGKATRRRAATALAADTVSIGFKKTVGPDNVRVTLLDRKPREVLRLSNSQPERKSDPRPRGKDINVKVEANGGAALRIEVTNASPSPLDEPGLRLITVDP